MKARFLSGLICVAVLLYAARAFADQITPEMEARSRVTDHARQIHDYVWTQPEEDGVLLMYYRKYYPRTNGNRIVFDRSQPYVVYGTVRGVPYTLATYGNGRELSFEQYLALSAESRGEMSTIYQYGSYGKRVSARFGMNCVTFLSDCLRQGFPEEDLPVMRGVGTLLSEPKWKRHFTFGKRGRKDYENLQTADFLECDDHALLVLENDPENEQMLIMEQTAPEYAIENCSNLTDVTVTLIYRDKPTVIQAKRLCMECEACLQATTGTQERWVTYQELATDKYRAIFVKY